MKELNGLLDVGEEELASMPWDTLVEMRLQSQDPKLNQLLAPYEHRAYARETVAEKPWLAPLYTILPFGYQAAKLAGYKGWDDRATPASLEQLKGGLLGVAEGVKDAYRKATK